MAVTDCVSISAVASLIGIPADIVSLWKNVPITAGIKNKTIIKKHDKIDCN